MTNCALLLLLLCLPLASAQAPPLTDDALWSDFAAWTEALTPRPPGQRTNLPDAYTQRLVSKGWSAELAQQDYERINRLRRGNVERERVYWNGAFKLGAGPSNPSRLLQEALQNVKPGRALDSGMGRGRNAIYLAGTGWDVTGYDIAQDALAVAQADAAAAKVSLKTSVSKHEDFDFGENQYDLIVCLYNFMRPSEPQWPGKFYRALRPGGLVVFQTSWGRDADLAQLMNLWSRFHILRYEDLDAGVVTDDWSPSRTNPTVRLVLRKEAR